MKKNPDRNQPRWHHGRPRSCDWICE